MTTWEAGSNGEILSRTERIQRLIRPLPRRYGEGDYGLPSKSFGRIVNRSELQLLYHFGIILFQFDCSTSPFINQTILLANGLK